MSTVKANTIEPASGGTVTITGAALTTPALGTPASGTLTNCTGLPASAVANTPAGGISATTVQAAVNELDSEKFDKTGGTITGHVNATGTVSTANALEVFNAKYAYLYSAGNLTYWGMRNNSSNLEWSYNGAGSASMILANDGKVLLNTASALTSGIVSIQAKSSTNGVVVRTGNDANYTFLGQNVAGDNTFSVAGDGNLIAGAATSSGWGDGHRITASIGQGGSILMIDGGVEMSAWFLACSSYGASGALAGTYFGKNSTTSRSINAGGTINASGADYAEYRRNNDLTIAKGQIVGYKADGTLTLTWSHAVLARVKSTDPCMVGGDAWGAQDKVGARPEQPKFTRPEYTGRDKPADLAPEPVEPTAPNLVEPTRPGSNADAVAAAMYALAKRDYDAAMAAHAQTVTQWRTNRAQWQTLSTQHAADMAEWRADQTEHAALVEAAQDTFNTETMPAYRQALAAFEARLEEARQGVDRIAYSGIVPCNVTGATPGHYIVAAEGPDDTIIGISVRRPTEDQWPWVVGRCISVLSDGRAEIDVMLS